MNLSISLRKILGLMTCLVLFTAVNCDNEPLDEDFFDDQNNSCATAAQNVADAALNFIGANADNYTQLCTAYRTALQSQIESCGDNGGTLQATVDALGDCSVPADDCETATSAASIAETAFNAATDDNFTQLCNAYKTALQNRITNCGDNDGSIQMAIGGLGDCADNQGSASIPGTWLLTAWNVQDGIDLNNDGTESTNLLIEMECYENETINFNENGAAIINSTSFADITVEFETGSTDAFDYTIDCIEETDVSNGTWTQNGNTITFEFDDGSDQIDLTIESETELSIFVPEGFSAISGDGSIEILEDLTFIYTKQ